jgi:hypothetical protein
MDKTRITVNGKEYKSPDEMPPDVRLQYEQAMQMMSTTRAGDQVGATTTIDTSSRSLGGQSNVVIQRTITVSKNPPPEMLLGMGTRLPKLRAFVTLNPSAPERPLPIEPSNMPSEGRRFVYDVAFWVIVGLALWFWLGRY